MPHSLNHHNVYLICYEDLCKDDSLYRTICKESGISNFKSGKLFISGKGVYRNFMSSTKNYSMYMTNDNINLNLE